MRALKLKMGKKSLARISLFIVFLFFFTSSLLFLEVKSQDIETSDDSTVRNMFLVFSIIILVLTVLVISENSLTDFLIKKYRLTILIILSLFLLIYFVPKVPFGSITGLFVTPTTTTVSIPTTVTTTTTIIEPETVTGEFVTPSEETTTTVTTTTVTETTTTSITTAETTTTTGTTTTITLIIKPDKLKWKEEMEERGIKVTINDSAVIIEKDNIEIEFEEFKESDVDWSRIVETTEANTAINEFLSKANYVLRDFIWVESNDFLQQGKYKARIILPSTYRTVFVCEGTKDDPECSIIQTCSQSSRPCYLQDGKTHVLLDHFSGVGGGDAGGLAQPYNCSESNVSCTETTVTLSYLDGSAMTINYQKPVNYFDEESSSYQQINQTITELPTDHPAYNLGYRYTTEKGIYKVYFKPNMSENWEVGLNVSNIILRYDLQRTGYLDYSDLNYKVLQTPSTASVILNVNEINYTEVFTGIDIQYGYLPEKLKEKMILNQTFRDSAPDPSKFGMNPATTFLVFESELDYKDLRVFVNDTNQTGNFTTENKIEFRDVLGNVKFFLPVGYAVDSQVNDLGIPNNTKKVKWRLEHRNGKHYLLYGVPVTWLISAQYPVVIDPTGEIPFSKEIDYYGIYNDLNDYYFNATDAIQMANHFQDYWSHNEICMGFYIGRWREYCSGAVDWTWYNSTDYSSYVNLTGVAEAFYGKKWYQRTSKYGVRVTLEHYLTSDSPEIKVTARIKNVGTKNITDTYLKIHTHDINVNATAEKDTFRINTTSFWEPWSGYSEYWLNDTSLSLSYTQDDLVSRKYAVFDNETESWVELEWNDSYWKNGIANDMDYNLSVEHHSEYNAPVELKLLTGFLNRNDVISTNFRWADAVKQNFTEANETYQELINWYNNATFNAYNNGVEFYYHDWNMSIEMKSDGIVHVKQEVYGSNENISAIIGFHSTAFKFGSFKYPKVNSFDTLLCPENKTNDYNLTYDFAKEEVKLRERNAKATYSISYLLVANKTGDLETYYINDVKPQTNRTFREGRIKLPSIFEYKEYRLKRQFDVNFSYTGTSHCIRFPIPRYSNLTINVTMLGEIANYTFGMEDFILDNHTEGNSVIANIRPYPCCEITGVTLQTGEVCSS